MSRNVAPPLKSTSTKFRISEEWVAASPTIRVRSSSLLPEPVAPISRPCGPMPPCADSFRSISTISPCSVTPMGTAAGRSAPPADATLAATSKVYAVADAEQRGQLEVGVQRACRPDRRVPLVRFGADQPGQRSPRRTRLSSSRARGSGRRRRPGTRPGRPACSAAAPSGRRASRRSRPAGPALRTPAPSSREDAGTRARWAITTTNGSRRAGLPRPGRARPRSSNSGPSRSSSSSWSVATMRSGPASSSTPRMPIVRQPLDPVPLGQTRRRRSAAPRPQLVRRVERDQLADHRPQQRRRRLGLAGELDAGEAAQPDGDRHARHGLVGLGRSGAARSRTTVRGPRSAWSAAG